MTGHKENSEFCFPETLNVSRGDAEGNIEVEGKQNSLFPAWPSLQSNLLKRTPQRYINEIIIWILNPLINSRMQ